MTVTVLLADDEQLIRSALAALLPLEADIAVVGEAADGDQAVKLVTATRPDVVVLDVEMPILDGMQAAEQILTRDPKAKVLMLTRHARPGMLRSALAIGVRGFLSKDCEPERIARAIVNIAGGDRDIDTSLAARALTHDCPLTTREQDVLRVTLDGSSVREIAEVLHLSSGTVRNYLSSAIRKVGASNRREAARIARANDWI
ncbi:DNA-binding response regulator [Serinibacter arcticus]|uniref:DNA-binding response regulator n=1 Tax=Serinibacter arcticus TaxID=1655435 RepID=A0A2U1ZS57_9MICO|nr:response regulator transcription factor [Serinibacter arcticus]PWD49824.1 DNA-binding response regulator [Serinibacter arcticus]